MKLTASFLKPSKAKNKETLVAAEFKVDDLAFRKASESLQHN
jgi:hypothetical protein